MATAPVQNFVGQIEAFVRRAEQLGKYRAWNAAALSSAIQNLKKQLKESEPRDAEYVKQHLDEILARSTEHSAGSIQTYISRTRRVINDFEKHGSSDKTILAWKPKAPLVLRKRTSVSTPNQATSPGVEPLQLQEEPTAKGHRLELGLAEGRRAVILVPLGLTRQEAALICNLINSLTTRGDS